MPADFVVQRPSSPVSSAPRKGRRCFRVFENDCDWICRASIRASKSVAHKILSWGRVALLGIAQRSIRVKFSHKLRKQKQEKPLSDGVKTLGDWIRVKRIEKNLTPSHLALKMGIASALVCSWEDDSSQPDTRQLEILANLLGYDPTKYAFIFPRELGKEPAAFERVAPKT
jgi:DNA-binding transcriptional regulator YiaG